MVKSATVDISMDEFVRQTLDEVTYLSEDEMVLPRPLTKSEYSRLFKMYAERHINRRMSKQRLCKILVFRNLRMARLVAGKHVIPGLDQLDVYSELVIALGRAAVKFKPELGFAFSTYAMHNLVNCVRGLFTDGYEEATTEYTRNYRTIRRAKHGEITSEITLSDGSKVNPVDTLAKTDGRRLYEEDEIESLKVAMWKLNEAQTKVIIGRFFEGKTLQQIADTMDLTKERIRQIETVALNILRGDLNRRGYNEHSCTY